MARKKTVHLSPKNEKALNEFKIHIKATRSQNKGTVKTYYFSIQRVLNIAKKDYKELTQKDLDKVFSQINGASGELIKTKFKIFLEWKKLNKLANSIKINYSEFKKPTKSHEDVLSPEEIQKFINTPLELRDRALIELYIASGGRRKEISSLLIGDIETTETTIWLHINHGKTGNRKIPLVANPHITSAISPKNFLIFYQTHPYKDNPTKPLFYSQSKSNKGSALNEGSINGMIKRIYEKSGIERKITPHILRHTSATYDGLYLSEQGMCLKYGWKPGSEMVKKYCHANVQDLEDHLKKIAGLTDEKVKEQAICPKCETINNINAERCSRCNFILDRELLMKELELKEKREQTIDKSIKELENDNKEYKQMFDKMKDVTQYYEDKIEREKRALDKGAKEIMENISNHRIKHNLTAEDKMLKGSTKEDRIEMITGKTGEKGEKITQNDKNFLDKIKQIAEQENVSIYEAIAIMLERTQ